MSATRSPAPQRAREDGPLLVTHWGRESLDPGSTADGTDPSDAARRFPLIGDADLGSEPDPVDLIEGLVRAGSFAVLHGPPGSGKTFLTLDWGFSVATGRAWRNRTVQGGYVVYVSAEGTGGLKHRVEAWKYVNDLEGQRCGVYFLRQGLPVPDVGAVLTFCEAVMERLCVPPVLVVLDTLNRCLDGGDEDKTLDMGKFIAGVDLLRRQTGTAVLALHHPGWNEQRERGNSSLRGAVDTMMSLTPKDGTLLLEVVKQKEGPIVDPIRLQLHPVRQSCVIVGGDGVIPTGEVTANDRKLLEAIRDTDSGGGTTHRALERASGIAPGSFDRVLKRCVTAGYVERGKTRGYKLSDEGSQMLVSPSERHQ